MVIGKGRDWGTPGGLDATGVVVASDHEAAEVVRTARRRDPAAPPPMLGLVGGDLCRTLGGRGDARALGDPASSRLPVDLGVAVLDGRPEVFVAHLVVRRSWWRGRVVAVMNAQFLGRFDVAPRSHPNDGRLDVVEVEATMPLAQRWEARRRLPTGTHVPHPAIRTSQVASAVFEFERPTPVWLDGERSGSARTVAVHVEPDALVVVV